MVNLNNRIKITCQNCQNSFIVTGGELDGQSEGGFKCPHCGTKYLPEEGTISKPVTESIDRFRRNIRKTFGK